MFSCISLINKSEDKQNYIDKINQLQDLVKSNDFKKDRVQKRPLNLPRLIDNKYNYIIVSDFDLILKNIEAQYKSQFVNIIPNDIYTQWNTEIINQRLKDYPQLSIAKKKYYRTAVVKPSLKH